ncbi:MAG: peptidylprolyl isomerase, partial [Opitutales bacterium]|nr:peptidylprolyl isomerase [Opitutales bacterium]
YDDIVKRLAPLFQKVRQTAGSEARFNAEIERLSQEILQDLIDRAIIVKEFRRLGMRIPESKLDGILQDDLKRKFGGDRSELIKYLQAHNKTLKQYRKDVEEEVIVSVMQNRQRLAYSEISPARILEFYNEHKDKWYTPESVKISQITLRADTAEEAKAAAKKVLEEIRGGLSFEDAAKKYSKDEKASVGGDWGWYRKGQLNPILDKEVFSLEKGQMSEVLNIANYAYILKIDDKKEEGITPVDEVREQIEYEISAENARIEYRKWLKRLREKAYIKFY